MTEDYLKKFKEQAVYLWNDTEDCFVKSLPSGEYFVKYPGKAEFKISYNTKTVLDAILGMIEVSKADYENEIIPV